MKILVDVALSCIYEIDDKPKGDAINLGKISLIYNADVRPT